MTQGEEISNDQIQKALPDPNRDGNVDNQSGPTGTYEGLYRGDGGYGQSQEESIRSPISSILGRSNVGRDARGYAAEDITD